MMAGLAVPRALGPRARPGRRHRSRRPAGLVPAQGVWARLLDDRRAIRLKVLLLAACGLAAALLEVPWP